MEHHLSVFCNVAALFIEAVAVWPVQSKEQEPAESGSCGANDSHDQEDWHHDATLLRKVQYGAPARPNVEDDRHAGLGLGLGLDPVPWTI